MGQFRKLVFILVIFAVAGASAVLKIKQPGCGAILKIMTRGYDSDPFVKGIKKGELLQACQNCKREDFLKQSQSFIGKWAEIVYETTGAMHSNSTIKGILVGSFDGSQMVTFLTEHGLHKVDKGDINILSMSIYDTQQDKLETIGIGNAEQFMSSLGSLAGTLGDNKSVFIDLNIISSVGEAHNLQIVAVKISTGDGAYEFESSNGSVYEIDSLDLISVKSLSGNINVLGVSQ